MLTEFTAETWPRDRWPNFSFNEAKCSHTGLCFLEPEFMDVLQRIRTEVDKPLTISSLFRGRTHPVESKKNTTGTHVLGVACDITADGGLKAEILDVIHRVILGPNDMPLISGIGVNKSFLHLDTAEQILPYRPRPWVWTY